jgi:hypothetical protein
MTQSRSDEMARLESKLQFLGGLSMDNPART